MKRSLSICLAVLFAAGAHAATVNRVVIGEGGLGAAPCGDPPLKIDTSSVTGVSEESGTAGVNLFGTCQGFVKGVANNGFTAVRGLIDGTGHANSVVTVTASSRVEVTIMAPPGLATQLIPVTVNPYLSGSVSAAGLSDPLSVVGAGGVATSFAEIVLENAGTRSANSRRITAAASASQRNGGMDADGANYTSDLGASLTVRPSQPLFVTFLLNGVLQLNASPNSANGYGVVSVEADRTFSFDPFGPALILPAGYSAFAEGVIVDNRWIDPRAPVAAVPLPATLPLLATTLVLAGVARRRRAAGMARRG
ncbi:hypothetical protein [Rubrimonas cliftonensis]|uniref:hypothetical protein n=1 Tax=Rubrimonas cliftonensis TaxID=89524 RepID=UPI0011147A24|nr:hypothetical protein [Rubrimonas cliftonensis]